MIFHQLITNKNVLIIGDKGGYPQLLSYRFPLVLLVPVVPRWVKKIPWFWIQFEIKDTIDSSTTWTHDKRLSSTEVQSTRIGTLFSEYNCESQAWKNHRWRNFVLKQTKYDWKRSQIFGSSGYPKIGHSMRLHRNGFDNVTGNPGDFDWLRPWRLVQTFESVDELQYSVEIILALVVRGLRPIGITIGEFL